ncbi:predicted protein [Sclerotinia sclerotiorum 1980 UF-70]|uniref:Uncharacterized protein n=1 Tax=Sclerotinia sclerotiorum (strain ATCC 18683 / 1980 / Ss-1) TaxID=665079 RepID=A7F0S8_SCLS1|nr:predicted protein [Sclerotinia sclerotiorum 1980 UF-70]EDN95320.1 predicted protein [Sclerotinia sclerotiorum 1980 UF-70]
MKLPRSFAFIITLVKAPETFLKGANATAELEEVLSSLEFVAQALRAYVLQTKINGKNDAKSAEWHVEWKAEWMAKDEKVLKPWMREVVVDESFKEGKKDKIEQRKVSNRDSTIDHQGIQ